VDTNFMDATDSLLEANRRNIIKEFVSRDIANYPTSDQCERDNLPDDACVAREEWKSRKGFTKEQLEKDLKEKMFFFHVNFNAVTDKEIRARLHLIPTTFSFEKNEMDAIRKGVDNIFGDTNPAAYACVQLLGNIMARADNAQAAIPGNPWCGIRTEAETKGGVQRR
jgi:hypothetical protein